VKVEDFMTKDPVFAEVPSSRKDVLATMIKHNITALPVLDKSGDLSGVVSRRMIFEKPLETQLAMIMDWSPPIVSPTAKIEKAASLLYNDRLFRLPVVKRKRLVGIITPTDLLKMIEDMKLKHSIDHYIRGTCIPIFEETPLTVASRIIILTGAYALPVLNKKAFLSGIVTDRDIFKLSFVEDKINLTMLGLGDDEDAWTWEGLRNIMPFYYQSSNVDLPEIPVKGLMVNAPTTVFAGSPVSKAAREMRINDYGQLPVMDSNNRLVSLVYDVDLLGAIVTSMDSE